MYRISRCDLCPAHDSFYGVWLRKSPLLRPLDSMHILDVKFLIENWKHYSGKLALASSDEIEKEHAKKQRERILWIFEQYGLSKEHVAIAYAQLSAYTQGVYEMSQGGECRYYRKQFDEIFNQWKEENERLIGKRIAERTEWRREH